MAKRASSGGRGPGAGAPGKGRNPHKTGVGRTKDDGAVTVQRKVWVGCGSGLGFWGWVGVGFWVEVEGGHNMLGLASPRGGGGGGRRHSGVQICNEAPFPPPLVYGRVRILT